jgi:hypothetical protein
MHAYTHHQSRLYRKLSAMHTVRAHTVMQQANSGVWLCTHSRCQTQSTIICALRPAT